MKRGECKKKKTKTLAKICQSASLTWKGEQHRHLAGGGVMAPKFIAKLSPKREEGNHRGKKIP